MDELRGMAESASRFPSQGAATVFESLNLHTEPSRTSPSFGQIPENGKVDVIGHKLTPRVQSAEGSMPTPVKPPPHRAKKPSQTSAQTKIGPPPLPPAPKPPANWWRSPFRKPKPKPARSFWSTAAAARPSWFRWMTGTWSALRTAKWDGC